MLAIISESDINAYVTHIDIACWIGYPTKNFAHLQQIMVKKICLKRQKISSSNLISKGIFSCKVSQLPILTVAVGTFHVFTIDNCVKNKIMVKYDWLQDNETRCKQLWSYLKVSQASKSDNGK